MADRWNLFVDYVREHHGFGRMELITSDVVMAYGEILADRVTEGELEASTAQNYISAVNRVLELARGDGRFDRLFRKIARVDLLILDDWGPDRLTATQRREMIEAAKASQPGAGSLRDSLLGTLPARAAQGGR